MTEITLLEELKLLEEKISLGEIDDLDTDILERMKVFDDCDWSNRQSVEKTLTRYIGRISMLLWHSVLSTEKIAVIAEDLSVAILEDIEVYDYSLRLWNDNMLENGESKSYDMAEEQKLRKLVERIYEGSRDGIAKYTMRYGSKKEGKLKEKIISDIKNISNYVGQEFYQKIYPVFWLEMLNRDYTRKIDDEECLVEPIRTGIEKEQYLFALLLDKRTEDISGNTIFSGIQRLYTARYKRVKKAVEKYDMQDELNRWYFVRWIKNRLSEEEKSGNRDKQIFINNIRTVREIIEIGGKGKLDIPAFVFFLDRLTGWIEFYNYVSLGEGEGKSSYILKASEEEKNEIDEILENNKQRLDDLLDSLKECTENDELIEVACEIAKCVEYIDDLEFEKVKDTGWQLDYAAFQDLIHFNHIAFLYAWKKNIRKNTYLKEAYYSNLGKEFIKYIEEVYEEVSNNREYDQDDVSVKQSSCYKNLYEELFVNNISRVNKATRMNGLNFYDTYITYTKYRL